jgi:hypothetical protein
LRSVARAAGGVRARGQPSAVRTSASLRRLTISRISAIIG